MTEHTPPEDDTADRRETSRRPRIEAALRRVDGRLAAEAAPPASKTASETVTSSQAAGARRLETVEGAAELALYEAGRVVPTAARPAPVPDDADADDPSLYFNRELSWIDFNWRVLYQAMDERNPLLERARFLAITENNLDEFVMKRVGGLKRQREAGVVIPSLDGRNPEEQLELIREALLQMRGELSRIWKEEVKPELRDELGLVIHDFADLDDEEREYVHQYFRDRIYPVLTPQAVDPGHPFPFISNLSLSLAVALRHPDRRTRHFARLKIPTSRHAWIPLEEPGHFVPVEQVVLGFVDELFRGMQVEDVSLFRVTRNADVSRDEEVADDLLKMISEELRERRFAQVVRLEVQRGMKQGVQHLLLRELGLDGDDLYEVDGPLDLSPLWALADSGPWEHRFEPWEPMIPPRLLREGESEDAPDIFAVIRSGDLMLHHPYDSFAATVQRFIEEAAEDPQVVAIKQTLYRTSENSPVVEALVKASESGKQVAVLVEVTARFDEEDNMEWASLLEESGVHVTYGVVGLKTHAKVALVLRDEDAGIRAYCHIGTGNYHSGTATIYADIGVLTARPEIGRDVANLFHYLTGYAPEQEYEHLLVAPRDLRRTLLALVESEIEHSRAGKGGRIITKMNGLDDGEMIQALYRASQEGVQIDLIVRGMCRLRPGIPGWSENIRVRSIVGRFLEHDRIFWFENGGDPKVFVGSADWRRRNLQDRVEVVLPVEDRPTRKRLRRILKFALEDNRWAWELQPNGDYLLQRPGEGGRVRDYHQRLMRRARKQRRKVDQPWDIDPGR